MSIPQAENTAGAAGTTTSGRSISLASRGASIGPAPPKATKENSLGSRPLSTVISRMAPTVRASSTSKTEAAARSVDIPRGSASFSVTSRTAAASSRLISPPRNSSAARYPRQREASVTVGSVLPRP